MIPRVINYVWLSGDELPYLNKKCVDSWSEQLPGYEIRKWTLDDFDIDSMPYVRQAVSAGKWAFATDCLRHYILFNFGGIYLDSDVLVIKPFEKLLDSRYFSCIEYHHDSDAATVQAAFIGAEKGHPLSEACLRYYENRDFIRPDGKLDTELLAPDIIARCAEEFGFIRVPAGQRLREGVMICERSLVAGTMWEVSKENVAVHVCAGSWRDYDENIREMQKRTFDKINSLLAADR